VDKSSRPAGTSPDMQLPLAEEPPAERADAARNRRKALDAASRLIDDRGIAALSLDEVAKTAQLGVGTVYRRFGDRASLIYALLDERERAFQAAFTGGPPPLGPGAPPSERIRAFLHAMVDEIAANTDLLLAAERNSPGARYRSGPYRVHRLHLTILISQARPEADAQYLADALLAPLSATMIEYQRAERGASYESIKAGLDDLIGWDGPLSPPAA
jgi:AcrR family transcriptional regulator